MLLSGRIRRTFVKNHDNIGAEVVLDANRGFRVKVNRAAIHRRLKSNPLFRDFAQFTEAPDLKAARVRQDRPLPAGKIVQVAMGLHHLGAGTQH